MKQNTQAATANTTIFVNLYAAIIAEKQAQLDTFTNTLYSKTDVKDILNAWQYKELITPSNFKRAWELTQLKDFLLSRKHTKIQSETAKELKHLQTVEAAADLISITVSMEWKKSRTWGSNPTAEARVHTTEGYSNYSSGSIGGCGYDKGSTAVANAVNQSNELLKALYLYKEANVTKDNRDLFGYGAGYGILPRIEGGVGVSCYPAIFEKIGFTFTNTAWGKTFDVYTITKNS